MHRSPIALFALCLLSVTLICAQDNPATPKPGSGLPQTPVPGANPAPQQPSPPNPAGATSTAPAQQPTPEQPANPGAATPATSTGAQPSADQQKSGTQPPASGRQSQPAAQQQGVTMPPAPPAEPKTEILDSSATSGALTTDGHDPILDPAPVPRDRADQSRDPVCHRSRESH